MITPTADQLDGFFHGMEHALALAEGRKRGKLSPQSHAIRSEIVHLRLLAETGSKQPRKAWEHRSLAVSGNASSGLAPHLKSAAAGVLMLCLFAGFIVLLLRGMAIEGGMQHDNVCKHYAREANAYARQAGQEQPCP